MAAGEETGNAGASALAGVAGAGCVASTIPAGAASDAESSPSGAAIREGGDESVWPAPGPTATAVLSRVVVKGATLTATGADAGRRTAGAASAGDVLLESVRLFDVYTGDQAGEGRKSLAYTLRFRAPDRTLTAEEASAARDAAVAEAVRRTGAVLRAG